MSEKKVAMSAAVNWQEQIERIAGPYDGNRKSWLSRAAKRANTTYRLMKGLYYGEYKNPGFTVANSILSAADQARIDEARRDAQKVVGIYESSAARLTSIDPDFHREQIDALVSAARILRGLDRA